MMKKNQQLLPVLLLSITASSLAIADNSYYGDSYKERISIKPVFEVTEDGFNRSGLSVLKRKDNKICLSVNAHSLEEGAYTSWLAIFNHPEYCSNPAEGVKAKCGEPDVSNSNTRATIMWSSAALIGPNKRGHFNACYDIGELSHQVLPVGTQEGLIDPKNAEIHVILKHHGPALVEEPERLGNQLNSFSGECALPNMGIEGFDCKETHFTIHK